MIISVGFGIKEIWVHILAQVLYKMYICMCRHTHMHTDTLSELLNFAKFLHLSNKKKMPSVNDCCED